MVLDRAEIAAQLRSRILSGEYGTGERLPGYRVLATDLGAAPNTVGEAVRLLAAEGLLSVRPGAPAVVRSPDETERTPEERMAATHAELSAVRDDVRNVRSQLGDMERRLSELLSGLES